MQSQAARDAFYRIAPFALFIAFLAAGSFIESPWLPAIRGLAVAALLADGAYAAVIPKWVAAMLRKETVYINGDGETARDFCYIDNVIQANLLAGTTENSDAVGQVYNVAVGDSTTLSQLFKALADNLAKHDSDFTVAPPVYRDFRPGDVRFSRADISKIQRLLGYKPTHQVPEGLEKAISWYVARLDPARASRPATALA